MTILDRMSPRLVVVDPDACLPRTGSPLPAGNGVIVDTMESYAAAAQAASEGAIDVAIVTPPAEKSPAAVEAFHGLLRSIDMQGAAALVLGDDLPRGFEPSSPLIDFASTAVSPAEIRGRLGVMLRYHHILRRMEHELDNMQRLFRQLSGRFSEVDQEMRLAGRLQDAFLPKGINRVGPVTFATLYRPATFVSGDIYDIYRVDESHLGFYVADAVGHGMAASLLTMFIKNAVVSKRILDDDYQVLDPGETLRLLNERLCAQQLPNSQFVTAAFGLLDVNTLELHLARAGHPYPILVTADGAPTEVRTNGGLLGLFDDEEFVGQTLKLKRGEKLILYSDGLEVAFAETPQQPDRTLVYRELIGAVAARPAEDIIAAFAERLDSEAGSLNPEDDVTLVVVEVAP